MHHILREQCHTCLYLPPIGIQMFWTPTLLRVPWHRWLCSPARPPFLGSISSPHGSAWNVCASPSIRPVFQNPAVPGAQTSPWLLGRTHIHNMLTKPRGFRVRILGLITKTSCHHVLSLHDKMDVNLTTVYYRNLQIGCQCALTEPKCTNTLQKWPVRISSNYICYIKSIVHM